MTSDYSQTAIIARDYYNSEDADSFYSTIWGGEDIHIGIYDLIDEDISQASHRTVQMMSARLQNFNSESRVLDIGAGYGGAARYLAGKYGCRVVALNVSEIENERHREMNKAQELDHLIEVVDESFEHMPFDDESFDIVWSQDAILHSGRRPRVLEEVARVLKTHGEFIFTDPMKADDCPDGVLQPILDRIHLESLGSPRFYRRTARRVGLEQITFIDLTPNLATHYYRILEETKRREAQLVKKIDPAYIERMKQGLQHWVDGGRQGYLSWGIFHFRKQ